MKKSLLSVVMLLVLCGVAQAGPLEDALAAKAAHDQELDVATATYEMAMIEYYIAEMTGTLTAQDVSDFEDFEDLFEYWDTGDAPVNRVECLYGYTNATGNFVLGYDGHMMEGEMYEMQGQQGLADQQYGFAEGRAELAELTARSMTSAAAVMLSIARGNGIP